MSISHKVLQKNITSNPVTRTKYAIHFLPKFITFFYKTLQFDRIKKKLAKFSILILFKSYVFLIFFCTLGIQTATLKIIKDLF